jgi:hydroxymethylpyrimidine pyrophosphatase-like HAD family hydrolase
MILLATDLHKTATTETCRHKPEALALLHELLQAGRIQLVTVSNSALRTQKDHHGPIMAPDGGLIACSAENGALITLTENSQLGTKGSTQYFMAEHTLTQLRTLCAQARQEVVAYLESLGVHVFVDGIPDRDSHSGAQQQLNERARWALVDTGRETSFFVDLRTVRDGRLTIDPANAGVLQQCKRIVHRVFGRMTPGMEYLVGGNFYGHHAIDPTKGPVVQWLIQKWNDKVYYVGDGSNDVPALQLRAQNFRSFSVGPHRDARDAAIHNIDTAGPDGFLQVLQIIKKDA